jgi:hypothetical protein
MFFSAAQLGIYLFYACASVVFNFSFEITLECENNALCNYSERNVILRKNLFYSFMHISAYITLDTGRFCEVM